MASAGIPKICVKYARPICLRERLARYISSQGRPHDEIIVECDEADADAVMAEVQAIMETRSPTGIQRSKDRGRSTH
jgi:hypothetical protein